MSEILKLAVVLSIRKSLQPGKLRLNHPPNKKKGGSLGTPFAMSTFTRAFLLLYKNSGEVGNLVIRWRKWMSEGGLKRVFM